MLRIAVSRIIRAQNAKTFATESVGGVKKLNFSFVSPYESLYKNATIEQVNLSSTDGDVGILGGHVPSILQLVPGLIEVFETPASAANAVKKNFFVSGGFAIVNPDSSMEISAMEAVPVEKLDPQAVANGLAEAQKRQATVTDDLEKAEVAIHLQVYQAMSNALAKAKV